MLPKTPFPTAFMQAVPLAGLKIPGLTAKSLEYLGFNYFVVVDNTPYVNFAQVYRENRERGKSNFVTTDSIVHPYFAFTNNVLIETISKHMIPDLSKLLRCMLMVSLTDYRRADDAAVRDDIERNVAYLSVGIKLLEPDFVPPPIAHVPGLVRTDLESIEKASGRGKSAILDTVQDFSSYQPVGWYNSAPALQNFYRCREWLSRVSFPLSDVEIGLDGNKGNNFRRAILLYRSLELGKINEQPAYAMWSKLERAWSLLGAPLPPGQDKTLSPQEFKTVFKVAPGDLKVTLSSLAEPLFRTKLMLSVRKQKPMELGSASIFEIGDSGRNSSLTASFRLFPVSADPEIPWLRSIARYYHDETEDSPSWPLALLIMHAWGAPQANNILNDNSLKLDPRLMQILPYLDRSILTKLPGGMVKPVKDRRWQILSAYFGFPADGSQEVLRTEQYLTRRLESAFAGWIDSHLSVAQNTTTAAPAKPEGTAAEKPAAPPAPPRTAPPSITARQFNRSLRPQSVFHYLEPNVELFRKIKEDCQTFSKDLADLGYLEPSQKAHFADFERLALRLETVAESELRGAPMSVADFKLLGNIDLILDKVVTPLPGVLSLGSNSADPKLKDRGINLGLGRPGQMFVILKRGEKITLARGAVYTYFEMAGPPMTADQWRKKMETFTALKVPSWCNKFDTLQDPEKDKARGSAVDPKFARTGHPYMPGEGYGEQ
jgi:hypothetical protein